jgi:alpha-1,6-mannosyltransferase
MASEIKNLNPSTGLCSAIIGPSRPAVILGVMGTTLVALAASFPGSPFAFKVPGAWFFGAPPLSHGAGIAHASGFALLSALACGFAGILLLCRAWLMLIRCTVQAQPGQIGYLNWVLALWSAPLLVAPPMFSNDIYSYAAQGEMVSHHISPYLYGPGVLGATPFASLAQGVWINTPSPYGPLFSGLEGGIVNLAGHRVLVSVVLLRLLAMVGVALIAAFLPSLARSYGKNPGLAYSLAVLNPLVLLFLIGSGHNDALMIGLLVAGVSVARRGHVAWGMVVCTLAGAIKAPGVIGVFAIAWAYAGTSPTVLERSRSLAKAGAITVASFEVFSVLFGVGWGWDRSLGESDAVRTWITPADLIAKVLPHVGVSASIFLSVAHVVGPTIAVAIGLWALKHLDEIELPRALGLSLLAFVLLGPIVQPWYLLWGIVILAITAGPRTMSAIALLSVTGSLLGAVGLGQLSGEFGSLGLLYQALLILIVAAILVVPIATPPGRVNPLPISRHPARWRRSPSWQFQRA